MQAVEIRAARGSDAAELARIRHAAIVELARPRLGQARAQRWADRAGLERVACAIASDSVWVACSAGHPCGWARLEGTRIGALYVDPVAAGRGIGSLLLSACERRLLDRGCRESRVDTRPHAQPFYARRGYVLFGPRTPTCTLALSKTIDGSGTFDRQAARYRDSRPGYPEALVDTIVKDSGIPPGGRILEVGCGTGQATVSFARRGYRLLCIERGAHMAALAAEQCAPYPHVAIEVARFEDWGPEPEGFDLALAAQSFHWIDQRSGYRRAGECLRRGGALALFWNRPLWSDSGLRRALDAAYDAHAPELAARSRLEAGETFDRQIGERIEASGLFGPVQRSRHPWREVCPVERYLQRVQTYSDHALLPEDRRARLLDGIREALARSGPVLQLEHRTDLFLARRR